MHDREEPEEFERDAGLARELTQELRRPVALPEGLADRIVSAVLKSGAGTSPIHLPGVTDESAETIARSSFGARPNWYRPVAAVLLFGVLSGVGSGYLLGRKARDRQAQRARAQFALAMEITGSTLRDVRRQLRQQLEQAATTASETSR